MDAASFRDTSGSWYKAFVACITFSIDGGGSIPLTKFTPFSHGLSTLNSPPYNFAVKTTFDTTDLTFTNSAIGWQLYPFCPLSQQTMEWVRIERGQGRGERKRKGEGEGHEWEREDDIIVLIPHEKYTLFSIFKIVIICVYG